MSMELRVRPAVPDDLVRAAEIQRACLSRPWTADQLGDSLRRESYRLLIAEFGGVAVGCGLQEGLLLLTAGVDIGDTMTVHEVLA